jgi:hypothetical protein
MTVVLLSTSSMLSRAVTRGLIALAIALLALTVFRVLDYYIRYPMYIYQRFTYYSSIPLNINKRGLLLLRNVFHGTKDEPDS